MAETGANGHKAEIPENERVEEEVNLASEFAALGRKFADAMKSTLESDEAKRIEGEFRKGLKSFTDEIEAGFKSMRDTETVKKVNENVKDTTRNVEESKVVSEARDGLLAALRSLSRALDDLAHGMEAEKADDEDTPE